MKQIIILISFLSCSLILHAQSLDAEITQKCDSILQEGNTLYNYEKAAWIFTDMAMAKPTIKKDFNYYLTYEEEDSIKCIAINKQKQCIYEVVFTDNNTPQIERFIFRELSQQESKLLEVKNLLLKDIFNNNHISTYKNFPPNFILLPFNNGYKLYAICGTRNPKTIPFGNDYLFIVDPNGKIQSKKQFHSRLIPIEIPEDSQITSTIHSHLEQEPFITATDICTFKLYGKIVGIPQMQVLSSALSIIFTYDPETNTITTKQLSQ